MKLRLENISKRFVSLRGRHYALRKITLEIGDREFFVLLGPSGCGKSTLLNLVAGLERPTDGGIWFEDRLVASAKARQCMPPAQRNVAMVFQSYALYPHMNVFDNIAFPLRVAREKSAEIGPAVRRTAAMLHVDDLLRAKPQELSGGQRQRVAIARAVVRRPDLFLLDEPLSNLDARLRLSMRTELKNLQHDLGITTIYVTHDQTEAMTLGDRIAVLRDGRIEQIGSPDDLYTRPANTFVATFVGSPPMNLLAADLFSSDSAAEIGIGLLDHGDLDASGITPDDLRSGKAIAGIRPEHIRITDSDAPYAIPVIIEAVESLGRERLLHTSIAGGHLSILTGAAGYGRGDTIHIELDPRKIHFFRE